MAEKPSESREGNVAREDDLESEPVNDPIVPTDTVPSTTQDASPPGLPLKREKKKKTDSGEASALVGPSDRSAASGGVGRGLDCPAPKRARVEFPDRMEFSINHEVRLLPVKHQIFLLASLQHPAQIFQTDRKGAYIDTKVIHENLIYILNQVSKNKHHATFLRKVILL